MKFLEVPGLAAVTAQLRQLDCGDRIINGRAELFSCSGGAYDRSDSRKVADEYDKRSSDFGSASPLGAPQEQSTKQLLITLILTMNQSFPEYDFSRLTPDNFHPMPDLNVAVSTINYNLAILADRTHRGFLGDLWRSFRDCIDLNSAEVYSYLPDTDAGPHAEALWSFEYFFYDKVARRVLFFSCVTSAKQVGEEDVAMAYTPMESPSQSGSAKSEDFDMDLKSDGTLSNSNLSDYY